MRKLIVGLGVTPVDLYGIAELDECLPKLAMLVVAFAALQIFELLGIAISRAAERQKEKRERKKEKSGDPPLPEVTENGVNRTTAKLPSDFRHDRHRRGQYMQMARHSQIKSRLTVPEECVGR